MAKINFENYDWVDDRVTKVEDSLITFDVNTAIVLNPKWYGTYKFRLMPVLNPQDWARQFAFHWNLVPGDEDNKLVLGCPRFTWGKECPICSAVDRAIAEKKAKIDAFKGKDGKNSVLAQKRFFVRALLLDYKPNDEEKKPPKFKDLPQLKIVALPTKVIKELNTKLKDREDFGPERMLHPINGQVIKCVKSQKIDMYWSTDVLSQTYEIPEEFLEDPESWPQIEPELPDMDSAEIIDIIEKNARNVHPLIANYALALDVGGPVQKQIESTPVRKKATKEELKKMMDEV